MLARLRERLGRPGAPAGYRPGVTLSHLLRNLQPLQVIEQQATMACVQDSVRGWQGELRECVQAHLLMHVVTCEVHLSVPAAQPGALRLDLRHTGALRRTGVTCIYRSGDRQRFIALRDHLLSDARLLQALMPLDFKRLSLECHDGRWQLVLEHMGGSEVVNRMPALRRYIRISPEQRTHLLDCLARFDEVLKRL
ncbi:DUF3156 family protein [Pseudomonas cremoricolorata]|uniref:DUF3156 domain-containing protein n=1 Tax=Pseudomonas cremoricolorata TaxID=157783 RepID=A0A089WP32_9PSED|nr:DUF3156 family protein [Pseudomonas cremoricolorata]AIR91060.1 hypothetical protein LK03_18095 [Pseudomonas cremoricolorata]